MRAIAYLILFLSYASAASAALDRNYREAKEQFETLTDGQRITLGEMLIASGHSVGVASRVFGPRLFESAKSWQRKNGYRPTGVWSEDQLSKLVQQGDWMINEFYGLETLKHPDSGTTFLVPTKLDLAFGRDDTGDVRTVVYESYVHGIKLEYTFIPVEGGGSISSFYNSMLDIDASYITYKVQKSDFFVINWKDQWQNRYSRFRSVQSGFAGFSLTYQHTNNVWADRLVTLISSHMATSEDTTSYVVAQTENPMLPGKALQRDASPALEVAPPAPSQLNPRSSVRAFTGSGFFVTADGYGVTNDHVIADCVGTPHIVGRGEASVVGRDPRNDLALIKINGATRAASIRRTAPRLGEQVYALGFPLAGLLDNGLNITSGMVSALNGLQGNREQVQIAAAIQPGNSGGGLYDVSGAIVGVVSGKLNDLAGLQLAGSLPQNINFAVKNERLLKFLSYQGISAREPASDIPVASTTIAEKGQDEVFQVFCEG